MVVSDIPTLNSLVRQLLTSLGDEAPDFIVATLGTKKRISLLTALSFGDRTTMQLQVATGITTQHLYSMIRKLARMGVIEVKGVVPNRAPERGGGPAKVWGLAD